MHHIVVDGLHVWCGDQWLEDFDQAIKGYYKENMTKRKNKQTGIEAMAGDGVQLREPTFSNVKNMFEELAKDNQTPEHYFIDESGPIEPLIEAMVEESKEAMNFDASNAESKEMLTYETSTPYKELLEDEKQLRQKVEKLQKFLRDPFKAKLTINEEQFNLLIKQYGYMGSYLEILTKRIQLFN